jgi:hypothetical protein
MIKTLRLLKDILVLTIAFFIAITFGCKTSDDVTPDPTPPVKSQGDFRITGMSGAAIYSNLDNTIHLDMEGIIASFNAVAGTITSYQFVIKQDNAILLTLTDNNFSILNLKAYGTNIEPRILANQTYKIELKHDPAEYIGNAFSQSIPNILEFSITIRDDNGYSHSKSLSGAFSWTPLFDDTTIIVYITASGDKYHLAGCRYLSKSKIPISLADACKKYAPCSVCKPPACK